MRVVNRLFQSSQAGAVDKLPSLPATKPQYAQYSASHFSGGTETSSSSKSSGFTGPPRSTSSGTGSFPTGLSVRLAPVLRRIHWPAAMASPHKMLAVQFSKFGGKAAALEHVEVPVPVPVKGEVLVKVEAASVNPIDWRTIQAGSMRVLFIPGKLPYVPGTDIGGEIVGLGPGVTSFAIGDKVSCFTDLKVGGSLAEYAVSPIKMTAKRPENVSALDGASFGIAGQTALQSVRDTAGIKLDGSGKKKNVLITAASGGVGTYAVQLAKLGGAHVTATCGARNVDLVKSLGADEVLDYKTPEGATLQSPSGRKYDVVIHCADYQPFSTFKLQLARTARVIDLTPNPKTYLPIVVQRLTFASQKIVPFLMKGNGNDLALLGKLVSEGKLRTVVDSTFPLSRAEQAWEKQIGGHSTGKVLVTMD